MRVSTDSDYKRYMIWKHGGATFFQTESEALIRYADDKAEGHTSALFVNVQVEPASGYKIAE